MGRRGLSLKERNPEPQVKLKMNEHGKVQIDQSEVLMVVGAWVVFQLRSLDDSGLGELVFQLLILLQKISC